MKRRILTISLIVASLVLLVSVGFAGWVISGSLDGETTGTFKAYGVENQGNLIVSTPVSQNIIFGAPTTPDTAASTAWFSFSGMNKQQLTATFTVQLDGISTKTLTFTPSVELLNGTAYTPNAQLIGGPQFTVTAGDAATIPTSGANEGKLVFTAEGTVTVQVAYSWGTLFGGDNPYDFFLDKDKSALVSETDLTNAAASGLQYNNSAITASTQITYAKLAELAMTEIAKLENATFTVAIA